MKVTSIDLQGFKSFLHKASFQFANNVSVIVGPNGCGKSNIVDAFKWVLADKSAKNLRCSVMEDVIFNGSKTQKATNLSQVTINFENSKIENRKFQNYRDIAITRKLFRSGESEYRINNTKCRLKDIEELLLELNLSGNSYNIISQDELGFLINAKPEERRAVIEDACGISKYRFQKKEIEKKIKGTKDNLVRIDDIFTEVSNQKSSLMVQAEKAKKFLEYKKQLKDIELFVAYNDYKKQSDAYEKVQSDFEKHQSNILEEGLSFNESERFFALREEAYKALERRVGELQKESARLAQTAHGKESRVASYDSRWQVLRLHEDQIKEDLIRTNQEILEKKKSLEETQKIREEIVQSLVEVNQHFESYASDLATKDNEIKEINEKRETHNHDLQEKEKEIHKLQAIIVLYRDQIQEMETTKISKEQEINDTILAYQAFKTKLDVVSQDLEKKLNEKQEVQKIINTEEEQKLSLSQALKAKEEELLSQKKNYHEIETKYNVTRDHIVNFSDYRESIQFLFTSHKDKVQANVLEYLDVSEEHIDSVSALLREYLECPIVNDLATSVELIEVIKKENKGFVTMFLADIESARSEKIDAHDLPHLIALRDIVSIKIPASPIVEQIIAHKYIVESVSLAREFSRKYPYATFATRDGIVFSEGCLISGGSVNSKSTLLKRKKELEKLEHRFKEAKETSELILNELEKIKKRHSEKEKHIADLQEKAQVLQGEIEQFQREIHQLSGKAISLEREEELRKLWQAKTSEERALKETKIQEAEKNIEAFTNEISTLKEHIEEYRKIAHELSREVMSQRQIEKEYLVKKTAGEEKLHHQDETIKNFNDRVKALETQQNELQTKLESGKEELETVLDEKQSEEKSLEELNVTLEQVKNNYETAEQKLSDERVVFGDLQKDLAAKKQALESKSAEVNTLMLQKERLAMKRDIIGEDIRTKYGIGIENYKPELSISYSEARQEEKKLELYLTKIGDVNINAIKEYEEVLTRFTFLESQKKDLENSLTELESALLKVNRNTVKLFTEAFEKVRTNFQQNIQKLFTNGSGDLYLTDPDNILESGVDLVIEPKGKSIRNINLLSGGEKALVLICYLISIFYYNPSPFCILDEIDAPLDDMNVDKFVNLVKSLTGKTQFLIISHNKKTMEMSEHLYGITMEEPGVSKVVSVNFTSPSMAGNA